MEFLELAKKRCSVRAYTEKPVEPEKIEKILAAGSVAPTACNNQPQKVLVIKSPEGLEKLAKASRVFGAPLFLVICADRTQTWKRSYDGKDSADIDAAIVTDHMMLQAAELGLGSVWICSFKPDVLRVEFAIPPELEPLNLLAVGYAAGEWKSPERHETERKPLEDTVVYEHF